MLFALQEVVQPLIRNTWSFDWDDITAMVLGLSALIAVFRVKRTSAQNVNRNEVVDADVLAQFASLFDRISKLEAELKLTTINLNETRRQLEQVQKLEAYLEAKVHEKDKQILVLRRQLDAAKSRIRHLELVCRRAGINGDEVFVERKGHIVGEEN